MGNFVAARILDRHTMKPMPVPRALAKPLINLALGLLLFGGSEVAGRTAESAPEISNEAIRAVLTQVARHQIQPLADGDYSPADSLAAIRTARPPMGITWNYPWGLTLFGLLRASDAIGDPAAAQFVLQHNLICARYYAWLADLQRRLTNAPELAAFATDSKLKGLMNLGSLDSCGAMGSAMLQGMIRYPETVSPEEKAVVARIADWVATKQDRLPNGTLWRPKSMRGTVWPDDLYMGGVFLVSWGEYTHDTKYIDDAANNLIQQAALEADHDGLWFHGYFVSEKKPAPCKWGRGNGWVTVTLVEILSALPESDPLRPRLLQILRRQVAGLIKVQAPDGRWRQVLDQPDMWEETSCTGMFAYGIARAANRGWIDPSNMAVARHAFAGLARQVTPEGVVKGTCQGTNIGRNLDFYRRRTQPDDDLHGRGPLLLAGAELLAAAKK
jgi:rhamnogalacturonyl hydrolase YesR